MRLKWIFGLVIALLIGACVVIGIYRASLPHQATWLLGALVALSILLLLVLYRSVVKPLRTITRGLYLLREQDFSSRLAPVNQPEADKIVDMFNSMMGSLKNERLRVMEQSTLMELVVDRSPMGIIMLDGNYCVASANPAARACMRTDNMVGRKLSEIDAPLARISATLKEGQAEIVTLSDAMIYRCSRLSFMNNGYPHPFFLIEPLTEEVRAAQKDSYGKVIRVISHEVNNSMTGVETMLETLKGVSEDGMVDEMLGVCVQRCRDLSRFITSYSNVVKIPAPVKTELSLMDFVETMRILLESMCSKHGTRLIIAGSDFSVSMDPVLMEQAVINIVKNSLESIGSGGLVRIEVDASAREMRIVDDGPGISDEAARHLFKPFYSNKPNGQGIGLVFIAEVLTRQRFPFSLRTDADGLTRFTITLY